ncbi:gas vesicle protein [Streptomyces abyssomicinicus]|uniref:gas vesicle protein n=1 Tax=Streptomyces abyssomicinicus TaxID=574929 RepID=UPI00248355D9|nr:gas vesicle protein [Streptomyces abyssomicinicus]
MNEEQPRLPARQATGSPGAPERWPGSGSFTSSPPRTAANARALEPRRDGEGSLAHVVETLLDKGLVLNADIMVSVAGVELLGIRLRAALASFETASRYGLEFPAGTDTETAAWREAKEEKEACPQCDKKVPTRQLLDEWCPWCGWRSAQALSRAAADTGGTGDARDGRDGDGEPEELERRSRAPKAEGAPRKATPARKATSRTARTARKTATRSSGTASRSSGTARDERKEKEKEKEEGTE